MDVRPADMGTLNFRFLEAWQCRTSSALSNNRKDDYVNRIEKKQPGKAAISHPKRRRRQEKHKSQVNISYFDPEYIFYKRFVWIQHAVTSMTTRAQQSSVFDFDALAPLTRVFRCSYKACLKLSCCVRCRYSCGRCCFEHFVSADERPLELSVHREHTENHQAALWDLHREVEVSLHTWSPLNLKHMSMWIHLFAFCWCAESSVSDGWT